MPSKKLEITITADASQAKKEIGSLPSRLAEVQRQVKLAEQRYADASKASTTSGWSNAEKSELNKVKNYWKDLQKTQEETMRLHKAQMQSDIAATRSWKEQQKAIIANAYSGNPQGLKVASAGIDYEAAQKEADIRARYAELQVSDYSELNTIKSSGRAAIDDTESKLRSQKQVVQELAKVEKQESRDFLNQSREKLNALDELSIKNKKIGNTALSIVKDKTFSSFNSIASLGQKMMYLGVGFSYIAKNAVQAYSKMQLTTKSFEALTGNADLAAKKLNEIKRISLNTNVDFFDLAENSKRMLAYGLTMEQVIPTMQVISSTALAMGLGADGINRISLALGQIQAKGKLAAEEMRQLAEAGIPAWQLLAEHMGVSVDQAYKQVRLRAVSSNQAIEAILTGLQTKYGSVMNSMQDTLPVVFAQIKNSFGMISTSLVDRFINSSGVKDYYLSLRDTIKSVAMALEEARISGTSFKVAIASILPQETINVFYTLYNAIDLCISAFMLKGVFNNLPFISMMILMKTETEEAGEKVKTLSGLLKKLYTQIDEHPTLSKIGVGVGVGASGIFDLVKTMTIAKMAGGKQNLFEAIKSSLADIKGAIVNVAKGAAMIIVPFVKLSSVLSGILAALGAMAATLAALKLTEKLYFDPYVIKPIQEKRQIKQQKSWNYAKSENYKNATIKEIPTWQAGLPSSNANLANVVKINFGDKKQQLLDKTKINQPTAEQIKRIYSKATSDLGGDSSGVGKSKGSKATKSQDTYIRDLIQNLKDQIEYFGKAPQEIQAKVQELIKKEKYGSDNWKQLVSFSNQLSKEMYDNKLTELDFKNSEGFKTNKETLAEYQKILQELMNKEGISYVADTKNHDTMALYSKITSLQKSIKDSEKQIASDLYDFGAIDVVDYYEKAKSNFESLNTQGFTSAYDVLTSGDEKLIESFKDLGNVFKEYINVEVEEFVKKIKAGQMTIGEATGQLMSLGGVYGSMFSNINTEALDKLGTSVEKAKDKLQKLNDLTKKWVKDFQTGIADCIVSGSSIGSMLESIGQEILKLITKVLLFGGDGLGGGLFGNLLTGMFTGGFATPFSTGALGTSHTGGIVGIDTPKFHSGGIVGTDEVPAILQKGEGVFTKAQMKAIGDNSGVFAPTFAINVNNSGGGDMSEEQASRLGQTLNAAVEMKVTEVLYRYQRSGALA